MKTFEDAFAQLVNVDEATPLEAMDRYSEISKQILRSEEAEKLSAIFETGVLQGAVSLRQALRYAFGQGVLTGIEMEKTEQ